MADKKKIVLSKWDLNEWIICMEQIVRECLCLSLARQISANYYLKHPDGQDYVFWTEEHGFLSGGENYMLAVESDADCDELQKKDPMGITGNLLQESCPPSTEQRDFSAPPFLGKKLEVRAGRDWTVDLRDESNQPFKDMRVIHRPTEETEFTRIDREEVKQIVTGNRLYHHIGLHTIVTLYSTWEAFLKPLLKSVYENGRKSDWLREEAKENDLINELRLVRNCILHRPRKNGLPIAERHPVHKDDWFEEEPSKILRVQEKQQIRVECKHLKRLLDVMGKELNKWWNDRCKKN